MAWSTASSGLGGAVRHGGSGQINHLLALGVGPGGSREVGMGGGGARGGEGGGGGGSAEPMVGWAMRDRDPIWVWE